jgi:hypothetical protein
MNAPITARDFFDDVAAISFVQGPGKGSFGSGYLIARGLVLTAAHVLNFPDAKKPLSTGWTVQLLRDRSRNQPGWQQGYAGKVVWRARGGHDLALLELSDPVEPRLPVLLARYDSVGTLETFAAGFPRASRTVDNLAREYKVEARLRVAQMTDYPLRLTVTAGEKPKESTGWKGISGGPVMHERDGRLLLLGVLRSMPEQFDGGQLVVAACEPAFDDDEFLKLLTQAVGGRPDLVHCKDGTSRTQGITQSAAAQKWPASDVIYMIDRSDQLSVLQQELEVRAFEHRIIVCAVRGPQVAMPDELNRSLLKGITDHTVDESKLFPVVPWPASDNVDLTTARGDIWRKLRRELPGCTFNAAKWKAMDALGQARELDALSDSISLAGGVCYLIPLDENGLSAKGKKLIFEELKLWSVLGQHRLQIKDRYPKRSFNLFLILVCLIVDRPEHPCVPDRGFGKLLAASTAPPLKAGDLADGLITELGRKFKSLPLVSLPPLRPVTPMDATLWVRKLAAERLVEQGETGFITSRFIRRILRDDSKPFIEILEVFQQHERYIWTGAEQ